MSERIPGKIVRYDDNGIVVTASYTNQARAIKRGYRDVTVLLHDGRMITPDQRRKAYALLGEISAYTGDTAQSTKDTLKMLFISKVLEETADSFFSLGNCDVTTAREFISFLIDFIIQHYIPTAFPLIDYCDDIERYVYSHLMRKSCAVCGVEKAQLHHCDAVGMGRNRDKINHIGMHVLPLCAEHHAIAHQRGRTWLTDENHLVPLPLTVEIGKVYGLTKRQLRGDP